MSSTMIIIVLFVSMLVLLYMKVPLVVCIGLPTALIIYLNFGMAAPVFAQRTVSSMSSFTLMAVPLFMLAGKIMEVGGISERIVKVCDVLVGWIVGGLAHVVILACAFFGALTGSAVATCVAIGSVMAPDMERKGYPGWLIGGLHSVAASLGVLIPPSIPLIIYGVCCGESVGTLFIAGVVPGIVFALCLMVSVFIVFKKKNIKVEREVVGFKEGIKAIVEAIPALLMPFIILGGIYGGIFTPSEAGAVACTYGLIIATFVYKGINKETIHEVLGGSITNTAFCMIIMAASGCFSWLLVSSGASALLSKTIGTIAVNKVIFFILVNIILIFMGMFIETVCGILIITPILMPTVIALGISPIHFGVMMTVNLALGLSTPPVGENQYIAARIAKIRFEDQLRGSAPFLAAGFVALVLITAFPQLSLWLPSLLG